MKIRFEPHVYLRHIGDESIVWQPRTGACTVMRDARAFLEKISGEWRRIEKIISDVARVFECKPEDVSEDVYSILWELVSQGFAVCEGWRKVDAKSHPMATAECAFRNGRDDADNDVCEIPFIRFCTLHNLLADLHIDLTDRCNERCVHCYIPKNGGAMMPTEMAIKILREFRAMEGLTVYVSGGEAMLHPDFAEILREAKRLGLNIVVMSNLTLCDEKMVALLKEVDPQFVNVSLYSMKSEEHDAITRLPGSWQKTTNAIRALKAAGVHVRLATPIMRENCEAIDELQAFAAKMQVHDIIDCDIIGRMDHDCSNQIHALGLDEAERVIRKYRNQLCRSALDADHCAAEAKVCDIGEVKININARGDYYPCDGGHGLVLGNTATDALADVWKGEKLNVLRALKNRDFPKCVGCANRPWCKVCVMRNFNETGDMFTPAPGRCALSAIHHKVWEEK